MALVDEVLVEKYLPSIEEDGQETVNQPEEEDDLPEKYRGKSAKEIALMHQAAEKLIGKQGSEVGDLRRIVDDFIKTQTLKEAKKEEESNDDPGDYFVDPKQAVRREIDNHPAVKEAKQASMAMRQQEVLNKLATKHPNFMDTIQDPTFAEWIESSRVRKELYARAEVQYDFDAADELLSTWQERQATSKQVQETSKLDRDKQLKAASVNTQGATESVAKKKYRRQDIIKLMQTDPDRYDAMQSEISAAYRENRII